MQNEVAYILHEAERLKSEIIRVRGDHAEMQVYEATGGLKVGDEVEFTGELLSVELGPGMLGQIFDGLQNPLPEIAMQCGFFLKRGVYIRALSNTQLWDFTPLVKPGDTVHTGDKIGFVVEKIFRNYCMVPFSLRGNFEVVSIEDAYLGIISFIVIPSVFVVGLFLIPLGAWLQRRGVRLDGEAAGRFPIIDLNLNRTRNLVLLIVALTMVNFVVLAVATYKGIEVMDTTAFCGQSCHSVMHPEFTTYQRSPHARVTCVSCHIGPGADWFVKSKLSGSWQLISVNLQLYPRPIPTPVHNLRPARETCEQCHWPDKFVGDRLKIITHFQDDEANTQVKTVHGIRVGLRQGTILRADRATPGDAHHARRPHASGFGEGVGLGREHRLAVVVVAGRDAGRAPRGFAADSPARAELHVPSLAVGGVAREVPFAAAAGVLQQAMQLLAADRVIERMLGTGIFPRYAINPGGP